MKEDFDTIRKFLAHVGDDESIRENDQQVIVAAAIAALNIVEQVVIDIHTIASPPEAS